MHQMYSKFSGTLEIWLSAFQVIRTRNLSIPGVMDIMTSLKIKDNAFIGIDFYIIVHF